MKRYKTAADIKVGVIGYGGAFNMGRHHLNEMKAAGMTPTAVMELDTTRLEAATKEWPGIEVYSDLGSMLKKSPVDLLTIITPHNTHAKIAVQCLNAGRHVVCEKPMAITTAECDAMIAAARKKGVVLSAYHNRHWDGAVLHAMELLKTGELGDIVRVDSESFGWGRPGDWWRSSKSISGGVMYDWGVHILEYSLQMINSTIKEVTGFARYGFWGPQTKWGKDCNEDDARAVIRFGNGVWMTLANSQVDVRPTGSWLKVTCTRGALIFRNDAELEVVQRKADDTTVTTVMPRRNNQWQNYYNNIAAHLARGEKLIITPEWARRPIHILDLANRSAVSGHAIKSKYE